MTKADTKAETPHDDNMVRLWQGLPTGGRQPGAIATRLGIAIVSGDHVPGEFFASEVDFAATLKVSRGVYREALQVLAAKGLVESRKKAGTRVLPRQRWNMLDSDVLAWMFAGKPNMHLIRGLMELWAVVEPAAAVLAAERRTWQDLRSMENALIVMRRHTLATEKGGAAACAFHRAVLAATGNETFISLTASIISAICWTNRLEHSGRVLPSDPIADHFLVYEKIAIGAGGAASKAMASLIRSAVAKTELEAPEKSGEVD